VGSLGGVGGRFRGSKPLGQLGSVPLGELNLLLRLGRCGSGACCLLLEFPGGDGQPFGVLAGE